MKAGTKYITIYTDASFCPETLAAGGAFWSRSDVWRSQSAFPIRASRTSVDAELSAILHATECAFRDPILQAEVVREGGWKNVTLVITSDCTPAMHILENQNRKRNLTEPLKLGLNRLAKRKTELGFGIVLRHVKAHSKKDDKRSWVNEWCDKHCKKIMKEMRLRRFAARAELEP